MKPNYMQCIVRAQAQCLISRVGHISPGKGGSQEKESFWKSGEGAKGGEDGAMDGNIERAWVGKERQMPYQDLV